MILRRRLRTLTVIYLILVSTAIWCGGGLLAWDHGPRIVGIGLAVLSSLGLLLVAELFFMSPLQKRLRRLSDLIRTMDTSPPPRVRGADEVESLRADLRRLMQRIEETRGNLSVRRVQAEVDSRTDPLTKLYNHRSFVKYLAEMWENAQRTQMTMALLIIDVDRFKSINDDLGHLAGNEALERVAALIRESVRGTDLAFRYAGDEFAVLLPRTALEQAVSVGEKIRIRVNAQRLKDGRQLSLSIGAAERLIEMRTPEELVQLADRALYQAKEAGRNQVAYPVGRGGFRSYGQGAEES